jgi:hypothetical protein
MIYCTPAPDESLDQGDLIDACPVVSIDEYQPGQLNAAKVKMDLHRVLVLTQTCDLANQKVDDAVVASVFEAQQLIERQILKASDIRGSIRAGRVWGLYFLPANADLGLGEMIVDLRRLHTVRLDLLQALCERGQRLARVQTPYREHLAKHFGDTFSRIGLPQPYETM